MSRRLVTNAKADGIEDGDGCISTSYAFVNFAFFAFCFFTFWPSPPPVPLPAASPCCVPTAVGSVGLGNFTRINRIDVINMGNDPTPFGPYSAPLGVGALHQPLLPQAP